MGSPVVFFPVVRVKWDEGTGSLLLRDMAQTLFSKTEVAAEGVSLTVPTSEILLP